jgi:ABC-2 type transport system permease protein
MTTRLAEPPTPTPAAPWQVSPFRVFLAFVERDLHVVFRRQLDSFLARALVEPLLLMFVFTYVLPSVSGRQQPSHGLTLSTVLVPGILANTLLFSGLMGVTLPLINDLSYPRTVQDRLLTPTPAWTVGASRVVSGSIQALVAALIALPSVLLVHAPGQGPQLDLHNWPLLLVMLVFGPVLSSGIGLWLGSVVTPARVNMLFSLVMMPAMMLGCVYYGWASLDRIPWLQWLVLLNPVVYMTEALRAGLTPDLPHLPLWAILPAIVGGSVLSCLAGLRAFRRATLD